MGPQLTHERHVHAESLVRSPGKLLRRSAEMIRSTVQPSLNGAHNDIDWHIRLVLTGTGPEYRNATTVHVDDTLRRVRNLYYDNFIYQECLLNHCKVHCRPCA